MTHTNVNEEKPQSNGCEANSQGLSPGSIHVLMAAMRGEHANTVRVGTGELNCQVERLALQVCA
eukprot:243492-Prymnesium_polylepis.1